MHLASEVPALLMCMCVCCAFGPLSFAAHGIRQQLYITLPSFWL